MNKKIIALAVAAAFTAPMAAQADVTTYGHGQVEFASHGGDLGAGTSVQDNARGRIGFKASEDLGNGLKAIANFEFRLDTATNSRTSAKGSLTGRQSLIGLTGSFGEITLGNVKTPYKYFGGVTYDPFVATVLESRRRGGMIGGALGANSFQKDSVSYKVKSGAMNFWLAYDLDDNGGTKASTAAADAFEGSGQVLNAGFKFKSKSFEAGIALVDNDGATAASEYSATKVFGQWKSGAHKISAQIESVETGATGEADVIHLNYQLKMGKNVLSVTLGDTDGNATYDSSIADGTNGITADAELLTVGLIHNMSKKTRVTVGYSTVDISALSGGGTSVSDDVLAVGMRVKF